MRDGLLLVNRGKELKESISWHLQRTALLKCDRQVCKTQRIGA